VGLVAEFYGEAGYPLPREAAARAFTALFDDPRLGRVWLVQPEGAVLGYLVLTLAFSMEFGGLRGFIDDFFVRPAARGRGYGAAALAAVRQACIELGVRSLLVETGAEGHPARRLYARAGFQTNGREFLTQPLAPPLHEVNEARSGGETPPGQRPGS
jgi:GNAT superfamily N-acetyltransferase